MPSQRQLWLTYLSKVLDNVSKVTTFMSLDNYQTSQSNMNGVHVRGIKDTPSHLILGELLRLLQFPENF